MRYEQYQCKNSPTFDRKPLETKSDLLVYNKVRVGKLSLSSLFRVFKVYTDERLFGCVLIEIPSKHSCFSSISAAVSTLQLPDCMMRARASARARAVSVTHAKMCDYLHAAEANSNTLTYSRNISCDKDEMSFRGEKVVSFCSMF